MEIKALFCFLAIGLFCRAGEIQADTRARVIFIGDVMAHQEQIDGARSSDLWDFSHQFRSVKPLFKDAMTVANLETVFAGEKSGFAGYPSFNAPDELALALSDLGVHIVTLANNHILDRGESAAARTSKVLDEAGIMWTGLGSGSDKDPGGPLVVEYAGLKWAFVNYSYGSNNPQKSRSISDDDRIFLNTISSESITEGLSAAREAGSDIVVACLHWGNEYQFDPTARQREVAALCVKNGADLVIGTHPHVLQPVEIRSSDRGYAVIAYSLGNFISYQRTTPRERSIILAVDVEKKSGKSAGISRVLVAPTRVSATGPSGRRKIIVVYAGDRDLPGADDLPEAELRRARTIGRNVLDFLGASDTAGDDGFYSLWDAADPAALPEGRRKSPE